jgi:hypothetical protein
VYSAKPWDYFLPPLYHPVFGKYVEKFVLTHLYGSNPVEQVLYVGYVALALAIYAIFKSRRDGGPEERRTVMLFCLFGLFALSFMPPPYLPVFGLKVPFSFSYLLHQFIPSFRVMARFDVVVMLSVSLLAGVGLKYLMWHRRRWVVFSIVVLIVLFEYAPLPSNIAEIKRPEQNFPFNEHQYAFHTTKIEIPPVYNWLKEQEGDFAVVEYPLVEGASKEEILQHRYVFYQRIHQKRLVNGAPAEVTDRVRDLSSEATVDQLQKLGVKYLIIHENLIDIGEISHELKLVGSFNNTSIYEVRKHEG